MTTDIKVAEQKPLNQTERDGVMNFYADALGWERRLLLTIHEQNQYCSNLKLQNESLLAQVDNPVDRRGELEAMLAELASIIEMEVENDTRLFLATTLQIIDDLLESRT